MLKRLYSIWCAVVFITGFLLICVPVLILVQRREWHPYTHFWHRIWAVFFFRLSGMPVALEYRAPLPEKEAFIYCPNHASYLDIPLMVYAVRHFFVFVGKEGLGKIPLFGYIFRKIHIAVSRTSVKKRYQVLDDARAALDEKYPLLIFPEGTFHTQPPQMLSFKEGAFRIAIEKQVPVVPVTIPFNWKVMPDDGSFMLHRRRLKVVFHEPIPTLGMTTDQTEYLKQQTYAVIEQELKTQLSHNQNIDRYANR